MQTQEAPLVAKNSVTKADILKLIPQFELEPVFLRQHLDREIVVGTIGDRGGGKSGSDAVIAAVDFMLAGKPVWSNMNINFDIEIEDDIAREYGLNSGGIAHYESLPLDKDALLELDESYRGGAFLIEEINVQYSNVRRFMTNTNVEFNEVCQQLRKFGTSLLYNVIDEMFIDSQLRALTDIFIKTYDTAFDIDALSAKKQTGLDFCWKVYPMTGYLCGEQGRYAVTHKALYPVYFHFGSWRGIYNSMQHQEKGQYSKTKKEREQELKGNMSAESSEEITGHRSEWDWLAKKIIQMKQAGIKFLKPAELTQYLGVALNKRVRDVLPLYGIRWDNFQQAYGIDTYTLPEQSLTPTPSLS
jgi:hypothetical protein